nr:putative ribonuclease H-like domain-containing protein [Tanacetum cinerariifolium]
PITNSQPNPQTLNTFQNPQFQQYHTGTSLGRYSKGGIIILPPVSFEEHVDVQRETKARTLLLQSLPEDHMADFYHLDDAREIWLAVKARFGGNEESKKDEKNNAKEGAKPDNNDVSLKFLRALPPSWSQVALTLKTRGGLEYLSFNDLYNKLRSLEIDVKGSSSYGSRGTVAPTHSAFIGATNTATNMGYSDQPSHSSSITFTSAHSGSLMEDVLQSFVAKNKPIQQLVYEDFEQAGRKINFNNKDSVSFDRRKARCYNSLQLGHFARECNVKKVDEKARYSTFKISEVKTEEPKAMVFVDTMLNWDEHEAEHKPEEGEQVYGLMAGFKSDFADPAVKATGSVYDAAAEFAMIGISPKVQTCPFDCDSKLSELKRNYAHLETMYIDSFIQVQAYKNTVKTLELQKDWHHKTQLALEEKVRILSANLENTTNTLKYSETLYDQAKIKKKEWEVKLVESLASIFDPEPVTREVKSLYERFVKAGDMHEVSPSITGTFMLTSSNSVLKETQVTFGSKSPTSINISESNDFVSCDNSDKSSESETHDFASCVSSPMPADSFFTVDVKILPKSDVKDPSPTNGVSSCSIKENVKPPSDLCNKRRIAGRNNCNNNFVRTNTCFVCGSKSHLIKDCHVYDTVDNFPLVVLKATSVPAGSRNSSASTSAGRSIPVASRTDQHLFMLVDPFLLLAETYQHLFMLVDPFLLLAEIDQHLFMLVDPFLLLAETDQHLFMLVDPFLLLVEIDQHLFMLVDIFLLVVLGEITDLTWNGVPRTMVDLINLHGFILNDPQGRLKRLISWQCKKQTVVATFCTEAKYIVAASCCGQSTIFIVKNPVFHQRTKHIEIRHHFIRDTYEKNLIQVRADDLVSVGGCTLPASSYSFLLLDWFLLVVLLVHADEFVPAGCCSIYTGRLYCWIVWATATVRTLEAGPSDIIATIDGNEVVVTESLIRTQLQLADVNGLYKFTLHDVLDGMRAICYPTDGSLTFYKAKLSPQWRFLIHTIIHCMSPKSNILAGTQADDSDSECDEQVLAGSLVSTNSATSSVPAASVFIPSVIPTNSAANSPFPPVHSLGSYAHTT